MKSLKLGLVGAGVGADFVARAVSVIKEENVVELIAVASARPERAKAFAEKHGISQWYSDYKEMFRKAGIEAVAICTPHYLHFPIAIDAIDEGLHVLVDKPMAISIREADEMIRRAEKKGVKLGVILQSRFDPKFRKMKKLIDAGELGKIILGEAVVKWHRTQEYYDKSRWRGRWATEGGGALINQAIHTIDLLVWMLGEPDYLWAQIDTVAHNIEVEDLAAAVIRFKNGAIGVIEGSTATYPGFPTRLEIHGTEGAILIEGETVKFAEAEGKKLKIEEEKTGKLASWARPELVPPENHARLIKDFAQAVREDRKPYVDGYEGKRSIEVILAIYASGKKNEVVKFPYKDY